MNKYKQMYAQLFNQITKSIILLQKAQRETEKMYVEEQINSPSTYIINHDWENFESLIKPFYNQLSPENKIKFINQIRTITVDFLLDE